MTFEFSSNETGSTFLCKLDKGKFAKCKSPKTYKNLKPGKHKFEVKASDAQGEADPSPVVKKFKIKGYSERGIYSLISARPAGLHQGESATDPRRQCTGLPGNSEPANSVIRARSTIAAEGCQSISAAGALIGAQSIRALQRLAAQQQQPDRSDNPWPMSAKPLPAPASLDALAGRSSSSRSR